MIHLYLAYLCLSHSILGIGAGFDHNLELVGPQNSCWFWWLSSLHEDPAESSPVSGGHPQDPTDEEAQCCCFISKLIAWPVVLPWCDPEL